MKKIKLVIFYLSVLPIYGQRLGVNTVTPTRTLDVNGETRVRILNEITLANTNSNRIMVANNDGTLGASSVKSLLYKEGLMQYGHQLWPSVKIGKSAIIRMAGRIACYGSDFTALFHYDSQTGNFKILATTRAISQVSPHVIQVQSGCGSYILTFSPSVGGNGFYDIISTSNWIQGTINTIPYPY